MRVHALITLEHKLKGKQGCTAATEKGPSAGAVQTIKQLCHAAQVFV